MTKISTAGTSIHSPIKVPIFIAKLVAGHISSDSKHKRCESLSVLGESRNRTGIANLSMVVKWRQMMWSRAQPDGGERKECKKAGPIRSDDS